MPAWMSGIFPFETNQTTQIIRVHKWRVRYASSLKNLPIWSVRVPRYSRYFSAYIGSSSEKKKKPKPRVGTREMAQLLTVLLLWRTRVCFPAHIGQLTSICNSSLRGFITLFWPPKAPANMCNTYTHKIK